MLMSTARMEVDVLWEPATAYRDSSELIVESACLATMFNAKIKESAETVIATVLQAISEATVV